MALTEVSCERKSVNILSFNGWVDQDNGINTFVMVLVDFFVSKKD